MALLDIFKSKKTLQKESNTLFGQTQLGNNIIYQGEGGKQTVGMQLLYVTTSSVTSAGRAVDMSVLSRNSTVMSCVGVKARTLAQLPVRIMSKGENGEFWDYLWCFGFWPCRPISHFTYRSKGNHRSIFRRIP